MGRAVAGPAAGPAGFTLPAAGTAGFTLIELLVVVAVLAVLAVGATLAAGRPAGRGETDLARFRERFETMRSLAVHGRQMRGMVLVPQGLRLAWWQNGAWVLSDQVLRWRGPVSWRIEDRRGAGAAEIPDILFLANGRTSAFSIRFAAGGGAAPGRCVSDGWTGLRCGGG